MNSLKLNTLTHSTIISRSAPPMPVQKWSNLISFKSLFLISTRNVHTRPTVLWTMTTWISMRNVFNKQLNELKTHITTLSSMIISPDHYMQSNDLGKVHLLHTNTALKFQNHNSSSQFTVIVNFCTSMGLLKTVYLREILHFSL